MTFKIVTLPLYQDNYVPIFSDGTQWVVLDPGEAGPIRAFLKTSDLPLTTILVSHHHWDHVDGVAELKRDFGCQVYGPAKSVEQLGWVDVALDGGETLTIAGQTISVIATPGHTLDHLAFYLTEQQILLSADSLFSLGCGRLFEGTPEMMWQSMLALRELPDETRVYCGHEYSASNAKFAVTIDPDNPKLQARVAEIEALRSEGQATVPFSLGQDKLVNPFLRADNSSVAANLGMVGVDPEKVFTEIRARKDKF